MTKVRIDYWDSGEKFIAIASGVADALDQLKPLLKAGGWSTEAVLFSLLSVTHYMGPGLKGKVVLSEGVESGHIEDNRTIWDFEKSSIEFLITKSGMTKIFDLDPVKLRKEIHNTLLREVRYLCAKRREHRQAQVRRMTSGVEQMNALEPKS